jgi:hypothetical protein
MKASDPAIWLADESGADRAILSADSLRFGNSKGKPLVALIGDPRPDKSSALRFYDADGKVSQSFP